MDMNQEDKQMKTKRKLSATLEHVLLKAGCK